MLFCFAHNYNTDLASFFLVHMVAKIQSIIRIVTNSKKAPGSYCAALLLHYPLISLDTRAAASPCLCSYMVITHSADVKSFTAFEPLCPSEKERSYASLLPNLGVSLGTPSHS